MVQLHRPNSYISTKYVLKDRLRQQLKGTHISIIYQGACLVHSKTRAPKVIKYHTENSDTLLNDEKRARGIKNNASRCCQAGCN